MVESLLHLKSSPMVSFPTWSCPWSCLIVGGAGRRDEEWLATGLLLGAMAAVVGFCFISMWWSSGLITVRVPWGALDEDFFVVPIVITIIASGAAWAGVWFWSQRS